MTTFNDIPINIEAVKKAQYNIYKKIQFDICMEGRVCPICTGKLNILVDDDKNRVDACDSCDFKHKRV